jgi:hypothetical protein
MRLRAGNHAICVVGNSVVYGVIRSAVAGGIVVIVVVSVGQTGRYPHLVANARSSVPSIALRFTEHGPR